MACGPLSLRGGVQITAEGRLFTWDGAVAALHPLPQINQAAAIVAEGAKGGLWSPGNAVATGGAGDGEWCVSHNMQQVSWKGMVSVTCVGRS